MVKDSILTFSSIQLLYASWMLASLILAQVYSSTFYSALTLAEYEQSIDTIEDLFTAVNHDTHWIYMRNYTFIYTFVTKSTPQDGLLWQIKQHMKRSGKRMIDHSKEIIPTVESDAKSVVIGVEAIFQTNIVLHARQSSLFHISSEPIQSVYLAWTLPKKSPLKNPLNKM